MNSLYRYLLISFSMRVSIWSRCIPNIWPIVLNVMHSWRHAARLKLVTRLNVRMENRFAIWFEILIICFDWIVFFVWLLNRKSYCSRFYRHSLRMRLYRTLPNRTINLACCRLNFTRSTFIVTMMWGRFVC